MTSCSRSRSRIIAANILMWGEFVSSNQIFIGKNTVYSKSMGTACGSNRENIELPTTCRYTESFETASGTMLPQKKVLKIRRSRYPVLLRDRYYQMPLKF